MCADRPHLSRADDRTNVRQTPNEFRTVTGQDRLRRGCGPGRRSVRRPGCGRRARLETNLNVETNSVDSRGASLIGFGITRLLNFDLITRFKQINVMKVHLPPPHC
ncbi:Tn3 family transposase [Nonomuraea sp. NPDC047529]|uniref:Tn3 family transposase n=1 Tax=Nonomuraea sp. NPDC047529 TaxID=3155623 RepID=UPI0033C89D00